MACDLSLGRKEPCKDVVGGIKNVYFVDFLPSEIQLMDVVKICFMSCLMSFLATLYPAYKASKTQIVEALRYD